MQRHLGYSVVLFALTPLCACGEHWDGGGNGSGGVGGSSAGVGAFAGRDVGGSSAGGGPGGGAGGVAEYPPRLGYEETYGCERVEHPGRAVLTLFDDPSLPFIPQHISGDGQVAAGLVGDVAGRWRASTGFAPYDSEFRGNVHQLDCAGEYAIFYDLQNRSWTYAPELGMTIMIGVSPSHVLPMTLYPAGGRVLFNFLDRELDFIQPYDWYFSDGQAIEEYRNTVLYQVDRDGYALGIDALRVFYNRPWSRGLEVAQVAETGPVPRVVVSGNEGVLALSLLNGSVLWGPIVPADPDRQRMVIGNQSVPLALSGAGRVVLLSSEPEQLWIEETYFTAEGGYRDLNVLAAAFGADLAGERLYAVDMSQDAQAFVGYTNRAGRRVGFHLSVPREAYPSY